MGLWFGDPGPCPVCDAPHTTCKPVGDTGPRHITQLPNRDREVRASRPTPPPRAAPAAVPILSMRERRKQRQRG